MNSEKELLKKLEKLEEIAGILGEIMEGEVGTPSPTSRGLEMLSFKAPMALMMTIIGLAKATKVKPAELHAILMDKKGVRDYMKELSDLTSEEADKNEEGDIDDMIAKLQALKNKKSK
jgi:hypothetical protein